MLGLHESENVEYVTKNAYGIDDSIILEKDKSNYISIGEGKLDVHLKNGGNLFSVTDEGIFYKGKKLDEAGAGDISKQVSDLIEVLNIIGIACPDDFTTLEEVNHMLFAIYGSNIRKTVSDKVIIS